MGHNRKGLGHRLGHRAPRRPIRPMSRPSKTPHLQAIMKRARADSNGRPLAPEASALSTELRAQRAHRYGRHRQRELIAVSRGGRRRYRSRMDLSLFFAGTGGSVPTARRGLPAVLVLRGGERLLFDCGEGTQRQLLRSVGLLDLDAVFITHFHADHWLGLPGMLRSFALRDRSAPLTVYGPPGLRTMMDAMMAVHGRHLPYELSLVEVEPWEEVKRSGYCV